MARNLKILGLCAVIVGASAAWAPAALAVTHMFHSESEVTYGTAKALETYSIRARTSDEDREITCNKYSTNTVIEGKTLEKITFTPILEECKYRIGETEGVAHIEMTSCSIVITGETFAGNPTEGEHAQGHLECGEPGDHAHTKVTALKLKCNTIPIQNTQGLRFENHETEGGVKDVIVESTIHDGTTTTENSIACPTKTGETEVQASKTKKRPNRRVSGSNEVA
jgi:hypothetical protein